MGRPPCCDKSNVKRGLWTPEEDAKMLAYVSTHGTGNWTSVPKKAGLKRCGKSCRLRWTNYLRPDLKHESFTPQEEELIVKLHATIGSRWSTIADQLPGRTDNDVKNFWNTKLRKKLFEMGIDPVTHKPLSQILADYVSICLPRSTKAKFSTTHNPARISCVNRDLRNALMAKSKPSHIHRKDKLNISDAPEGTIKPETGMTQNSFFNNNSAWDLLAQLHAIKLVTEASNSTNQEPIQAHYLNQSSCSTSFTNHQDNIQANASPSQVQNASSSSSSSFSWSEFLLDDAFLSPNQEKLPVLAATDSSSNQFTTNEIFFPDAQFDFVNAETQQGNGVPEIGNCPMLSPQDYTGDGYDAFGGQMNDTYWTSSDNSFVEAILDRDSEMLWEFPDLVDDP